MRVVFTCAIVYSTSGLNVTSSSSEHSSMRVPFATLRSSSDRTPLRRCESIIVSYATSWPSSETEMRRKHASGSAARQWICRT